MQFSVANPLLFLDDFGPFDAAFYDEPLVLPTATQMPMLLPPRATTSISHVDLLPSLTNYQVPQVNQLPPTKKRALNGGGVYYPPQKVLPRPPNMSKHQDSFFPNSSDSTSSTGGSSDGLLVEEQRKERNRKHAKRSRQRRKCLTEDLQQCMSTLRAENSKLREALYSHVGDDQKPKIDSMVISKISKPTDEFIEELKSFRKQALDNKTRTYLRTLSKTATKCAEEFRNNNELLLLDEEDSL